MKKIAAVAVILSCFVCGLFAVGTVAGNIAFLSPIVGSNPGVTIAGVQSGAAPWLSILALALCSCVCWHATSLIRRAIWHRR
jgi:hypothetical protein